MRYGYINEFGTLTSKEFTEGEATNLDSIWKPVADISVSQAKSDEAGYFIKLQPYDAGDRIEFRYVKKFDKQIIKKQIEELQAELESTDYKVIKCYEASLAGVDMPYNVQVLIDSRQGLRDKINVLQKQLINA